MESAFKRQLLSFNETAFTQEEYQKNLILVFRKACQERGDFFSHILKEALSEFNKAGGNISFENCLLKILNTNPKIENHECNRISDTLPSENPTSYYLNFNPTSPYQRDVTTKEGFTPDETRRLERNFMRACRVIKHLFHFQGEINFYLPHNLSLDEFEILEKKISDCLDSKSFEAFENRYGIQREVKETTGQVVLAVRENNQLPFPECPSLHLRYLWTFINFQRDS